jgi:alpha-L-rhamnosidase
MNSMNHVMMIGDLLIWEYEYLGGIRPAEPGFAKVELKPYPVPGLDWVKCSYDSEHGRIVSNWKRRGKKIIWKVEVPVPATALIPSADGSGREVRELAPGKYRFKF